MKQLITFIIKFIFFFLIVYVVVRYPKEVRAVQEVCFGWIINISAPLVNKIYVTIMEIN